MSNSPLELNRQLKISRRNETLPGRNDKCPCGSGKKFKHCHLPIARDKVQKQVIEQRNKNK